MGKYEDRMFTPFSTKDQLTSLVSKICETEQLMESTVRDLLSHGWAYHGNQWTKTKSRGGTRADLVVFDEANLLGD